MLLPSPLIVAIMFQWNVASARTACCNHCCRKFISQTAVFLLYEFATSFLFLTVLTTSILVCIELLNYVTGIVLITTDYLTRNFHIFCLPSSTGYSLLAVYIRQIGIGCPAACGDHSL